MFPVFFLNQKKKKLGDDGDPPPTINWNNSYLSENAVPYIWTYISPTPSPIVVASGQIMFLDNTLNTTDDSAQTAYAYVSFTSANGCNVQSCQYLNGITVGGGKLLVQIRSMTNENIYLRAFITNTIEDSINNVWQVQVNPQTVSTIFSDQTGVAVSVVQYPFLGNLVDVNPANKSDSKLLMWDQTEGDYNFKAYTDTSFAYNISTDTQISYALPGRFKFLDSSGNPTLDPTVLNTADSILLSLYDINGNNVSANIENTMSNSAQLHIRDPTNNVNEIFFTVGNGSQDSNQFIITNITLNSHFGSFTAENMYLWEFVYPVKLSQQQDVYINSPQDGDVLTFKVADSNHWTNQQPSGGGGSSTLAGDTDVSINVLTLGDGQTLTYHATDTKWENKDPNTFIIWFNI